MFRSQVMHKVELVVPEHDVVVATEALAASRLFHMSSAAQQDESEMQTNSWVEQASTYMSLEQRLVNVMELLGVDPGAPPDEGLHLISPDVASRDIDTLEHEAREPVRELHTAWEKLDRLRELRDQYQLLVGLKLDLRRFRDSQHLFSMLGSMPASNVDRLQTSLEHVPSALVVLNERERLATVILFGLRKDAEVLTRAARSAYLNAFELPPEYAGTAEEVTGSLSEAIDRAREHIADLQGTIHHLHETRIRRLRHLLWRVRASRRLAQTIGKFKRFKYAYMVEGWVPVGRLPDLRRQIDQVSEEVVIETHLPDARERKEAPFEFDNPPFVRMFEQLVTTYGYPKYEDLDPTPLMALTFPLIYGMMFGDVGHGLLLTLLGVLLMSRRIKALNSMAELGKIMAVSGIMAALFGVLYGSVFGFEDLLHPVWFRPLTNTTEILLVSVFFGVAVLTLGIVYNMIDAALKKRWADLTLERDGIAGLILYWAMLGLGAQFLNAALPIGTSVLLPLLVVGGLVLAFAALIRPLIGGEESREGLGMTLVQGAFEVFETVLSLFSNTLSYVRVGAFAIAHGALMRVVFILALLIDPAQSVGYWVVVVLGNLVVVGFEGLIVGIQTLRLEYYEFFSKFFRAGGIPFHPLTLVGSDEG